MNFEIYEESGWLQLDLLTILDYLGVKYPRGSGLAGKGNHLPYCMCRRFDIEF